MIKLKLLNSIRDNRILYEFVVTMRDYASFLKGMRRGTFAQHAEDRFILDYFGHKKSGNYLDIGASHPFRISNTYLLYRHGWRGTSVEPIPRFADLHKNWRPDDTYMAVAVGLRAGKKTFYEMTPSVLSTLDADVARQYQCDGRAVLHRELDIDVVTTSNIFEQATKRGRIDFLSVDVEGLDLKLIESVDFKKYRPALICIEANDDCARRSIVCILEGAGYQVIKTVKCNLFAAPIHGRNNDEHSNE